MHMLWLALAALSTGSGPSPLTLQRMPTCVVAGRYPVMTAQLPPSVRPAASRLLFATEEAWFTVTMTRTDDRLEAVLPKPKGSLHEFRYRIETTDETAGTASTAEHVVRVLHDRESCPAETGAHGLEKLEDSLMVLGPRETRHGKSGLGPLVPRGFSPKGVVGDIGTFDLSAPVAIGASAVLVGAAAVGVATIIGQAPEARDPFFPNTTVRVALQGSDPPVGGPLSLSQTLSLSFVFTAGTDVLAGPLRVLLATGQTVCGEVDGDIPALALGQPTTVLVSGPILRPNQGCVGTDAVSMALTYDAVTAGRSFRVSLDPFQLQARYTIQP